MKRFLSDRSAIAGVATLGLLVVACSFSRGGHADSTGARPATRAGAGGAAGSMDAGTPMRDSALAMLHGFCASEGPAHTAAGNTRRIELVVGGEARQRATRITVTSDSTAKADVIAELTAGSDAHAMCAGPPSTILIGGTAMFLGAPTLTITSSAPVTVVARTAYAEVLAGPVDVRPGQRGVVLSWAAARR